MHISALTVCVGYSDFLEKSLACWIRNCDRIIIVTDLDDEQTPNLIVEHDSPKVDCYRTNKFYQNGATFNKAAAICWAIESHGMTGCDCAPWLNDWQLFFDSDIIPQGNWREVFEQHAPQIGNLYGAKRYLEDGNMFNENELAGYFQIFHATDEHVFGRNPLLQTNWAHAGGYDSEFHQRWEEREKIYLPIRLVHQGLPGENWWGKGQIEKMEYMKQKRRECDGIWEGERVKR